MPMLVMRRKEAVGGEEGVALGVELGLEDGLEDCAEEGDALGADEGAALGVEDGAAVGEAVGTELGFGVTEPSTSPSMRSLSSVTCDPQSVSSNSIRFVQLLV